MRFCVLLALTLISAIVAVWDIWAGITTRDKHLLRSGIFWTLIGIMWATIAYFAT